MDLTQRRNIGRVPVLVDHLYIMLASSSPFPSCRATCTGRPSTQLKVAAKA